MGHTCLTFSLPTECRRAEKMEVRTLGERTVILPYLILIFFSRIVLVTTDFFSSQIGFFNVWVLVMNIRFFRCPTTLCFLMFGFWSQTCVFHLCCSNIDHSWGILNERKKNKQKMCYIWHDNQRHKTGGCSEKSKEQEKN